MTIIYWQWVGEGNAFAHPSIAFGYPVTFGYLSILDFYDAVCYYLFMTHCVVKALFNAQTIANHLDSGLVRMWVLNQKGGFSGEKIQKALSLLSWGRLHGL